MTSNGCCRAVIKHMDTGNVLGNQLLSIYFQPIYFSNTYVVLKYRFRRCFCLYFEFPALYYVKLTHFQSYVSQAGFFGCLHFNFARSHWHLPTQDNLIKSSFTFSAMMQRTRHCQHPKGTRYGNGAAAADCSVSRLTLCSFHQCLGGLAPRASYTFCICQHAVRCRIFWPACQKLYRDISMTHLSDILQTFREKNQQ